MVFSSISSSRRNLSLQQTLDLANLFLENAYKSMDPEIVLVLCHETETSLSRAKKVARRTKIESMNGCIATLYGGLCDLLDRHGHRGEAAEFRKMAENLR